MKCFRIRIIMGILFLVVLVGGSGLPARAVTPAELKEEWWVLRDFPIPYGDERLGSFSYQNVLDILNPPEDMLPDFSTSELAELVLRHPHMNDMLGFTDSDMHIYFSALKGNSHIFSEFLWREGCVDAILDAYEALPYEVEAVNGAGDPVVAFMEVPSFRKEVFIREFTFFYLSRFSEEEAERFLAIRAQRDEEFYSKLQNESIRKRFMQELDMKVLGRDLISGEEIQAKWRDAAEYPLTKEDSDWDRFTIWDKWRILNPPVDVTESLETVRLVELVLTHPLLWEDDNNVYKAFSRMEQNCSLFQELLNRKDGNKCILEAYASNELNLAAANSKGVESADSSVRRERFICHYIDQYADKAFSEDDIALYERIYRGKKAVYEELKDEKLRGQLETRLSAKMDSVRPEESMQDSQGQEENLSPEIQGQVTDRAETSAEENGKRQMLLWIGLGFVAICGGAVLLLVRKKHKE